MICRLGGERALERSDPPCRADHPAVDGSPHETEPHNLQIHLHLSYWRACLAQCPAFECRTDSPPHRRLHFPSFPNHPDARCAHDGTKPVIHTGQASASTSHEARNSPACSRITARYRKTTWKQECTNSRTIQRDGATHILS